MNKKSRKAQRKKIIEQQSPLYLTEGHWDEVMLEENSYYDIDILNKHNRPINKKIEEWSKRYDEASSWLGKWYCQSQIDKFRSKLKHYESKS